MENKISNLISIFILALLITLMFWSIKVASNRQITKDCLQVQQWTETRNYVPNEQLAKDCSEIGINFKP